MGMRPPMRRRAQLSRRVLSPRLHRIRFDGGSTTAPVRANEQLNGGASALASPSSAAVRHSDRFQSPERARMRRYDRRSGAEFSDREAFPPRQSAETSFGRVLPGALRRPIQRSRAGRTAWSCLDGLGAGGATASVCVNEQLEGGTTAPRSPNSAFVGRFDRLQLLEWGSGGGATASVCRNGLREPDLPGFSGPAAT
jgi:hypothetical protein